METIISTLNKNTIVWKANPSYYDYIHNMTLNFDTHTFKLCDGGGQIINIKCNGTFEIKGDQLILNYQNEINPYCQYNDSNSVKPINLVKHIGFQIKTDQTYHFNGYTKYQSKWIMTLDSSPFNIENVNKQRKYNLFNLIADNSYPLTFYTGFESIVCDVAYERVIKDEAYHKKNFLDYVDNNLSYVKNPNSEEIRQINSSRNYQYWTIIHFDKEKKEIIMSGYWKCQPIFVIRKNDIIKYYVPDSNTNQYVETTDDNTILKYSPENIHPKKHPFNELIY